MHDDVGVGGCGDEDDEKDDNDDDDDEEEDEEVLLAFTQLRNEISDVTSHSLPSRQLTVE